ncbi:two-component system sensor histidine kinase NtrB [Symmachiella dynata]|uniref:two-component system sensor histidine kinase NtrB n=1 Tax=Symmachiella dynata TaxID=2527995 RepID=UPI0030ED914E
MNRMFNEQGQDQTTDRQLDSYVFRAIADYTYDWESWHAPDGRLLWLNAAVERMTGYRRDECLKMPDYPLALVAEEDLEKVADVLQDAKNGGSGNDVEFQLLHRDGSMRWAAVSWQPMYDESQKHLGFRASVRDITERQQFREELRLYNQHLEQLVQERTAKIAQLEEHRLKMEKLAALGQMAAGVAHEVNNPLAGIRNAFALFKSNLSADDENYELLELIDGEIERISSITHQMYQLYRPSQQSPAKFDLCRVIASVVVLLEPMAEKSNVEVKSQSDRCVPDKELGATEVVLRESELRQILLNVIRNAIQASPSSAVVQIDVTTTADLVTIAVSDQGKGISNEVAARMFEPFFSTKTGTRQGMGLGLSVSRSLAEAMGGKIVIENERAKGACVKIMLPRRISTHE